MTVVEKNEMQWQVSMRTGCSSRHGKDKCPDHYCNLITVFFSQCVFVYVDPAALQIATNEQRPGFIMY